MPLPKHDVKQQAQFLYFNTDKTQDEIAKDLGISPQCMSRWAKGGNWRALKKAALQSPAALTQQLYDELEEINNNIRRREDGARIPTREEQDMRTKIIANIRPLKKLIAQPELQQVFFGLHDFLKRCGHTNPDLKHDIAAFITGFSNEVIRPADVEYTFFQEQRTAHKTRMHTLAEQKVAMVDTGDNTGSFLVKNEPQMNNTPHK